MSEAPRSSRLLFSISTLLDHHAHRSPETKRTGFRSRRLEFVSRRVRARLFHHPLKLAYSFSALYGVQINFDGSTSTPGEPAALRCFSINSGAAQMTYAPF